MIPEHLAHQLSVVNLDVQTSPLFDGAWYQSEYGDLDDATDPAQHFLEVGLAEGRNPNPYMDTAWYYEHYPDVKTAGANAFLHYLEHGWREMRDPSGWFSTGGYLSANSEVATAKVNPLQHYLERGRGEGRSPTGMPRRQGRIELLARAQDRGSIVLQAWLDELQGHGFPVNARFVDSDSVLDRTRFAIDRLLRALPFSGKRWLTVSFNGAGLTAALAKSRRRNFLAVFDDVRAAQSLRKRARKALKHVKGATSSAAAAAAMVPIMVEQGVWGYSEPMNGKLLQAGAQDRSVDIMWRCQSPQGSDEVAVGEAVERSKIIDLLADRQLQLVGDAGWRRWGEMFTNVIDIRDDWQMRACARECYGRARLALVTPPVQRSGEVNSELVAALASGALPVAHYDLASALFAIYGNDCPIPLYKDLRELDEIIAHYLEADEERAALVSRCRMLALQSATYSTRLGRLISELGTKSVTAKSRMLDHRRTRR